MAHQRRELIDRERISTDKICFSEKFLTETVISTQRHLYGCRKEQIMNNPHKEIICSVSSVCVCWISIQSAGRKTKHSNFGYLCENRIENTHFDLRLPDRFVIQIHYVQTVLSQFINNRNSFSWLWSHNGYFIYRVYACPELIWKITAKSAISQA